MRKLDILCCIAGCLLVATPASAAQTDSLGLPVNKLHRAYACAGVLYAELAMDRVDTPSMIAMDEASVAWLEEAGRLGGDVPEDGVTNDIIDAAGAAYESNPGIQAKQLQYCLSNAPR